jgi:hypothetical protein
VFVDLSWVTMGVLVGLPLAALGPEEDCDGREIGEHAEALGEEM